MSGVTGIQGWTIKTCPRCKRSRTHYRIGTKWKCIGLLRGDRRSQRCRERQTSVLPTP